MGSDEDKSTDNTDMKNSERKKVYGNSNAREKNISNSIVSSTTDRDARVSVKPGKARRLNLKKLLKFTIESKLLKKPIF